MTKLPITAPVSATISVGKKLRFFIFTLFLLDERSRVANGAVRRLSFWEPLACVGDDQAVAKSNRSSRAQGDGFVVGDEHDSPAGGVEFVEQGEDLFTGRRV